jgi:hypothetical protein
MIAECDKQETRHRDTELTEMDWKMIVLSASSVSLW